MSTIFIQLIFIESSGLIIIEQKKSIKYTIFQLK